MRCCKTFIWCLVLAFGLSACNQRENEIAEAAGAKSSTPWLSDFDSALKQAKEQRKPVLADFFATWCGPCKLMDQKTFPDRAVVNELTNWILVRIDVDQQPELARKFNVEAIPTMVLINPDGKVISTKTGYIPPAELLSFAEAGRSTLAK